MAKRFEIVDIRPDGFVRQTGFDKFTKKEAAEEYLAMLVTQGYNENGFAYEVRECK